MIPICHYCRQGLSKEEKDRNRNEKVYQRSCDGCKKELGKKLPL